LHAPAQLPYTVETTRAPAGFNPGAAVLTDAYTVPANKRAIVAISVANRAAAGRVYRLALAPAGAADALTQYIAYDITLVAGATDVWDEIPLAAGDVVRVYATTGDVTFNVVAVEHAP
jgi:hypothetical protein